MKLILLMAITLDGRTGKDAMHFVDWTEQEDKRFFVQITKKAGVIIMGSRTFDTISGPLAGRKNIILTRNPQNRPCSDNLVFTNQSPSELLKHLEKEGFSEVVLAGGPTINTLFAREKLIDEIIVTVSPLIFGYGTSLFSEDIAMELELKDVQKRGKGLIAITYAVNNVTVNKTEPRCTAFQD
ncbi:MAG: dihydrofolate reductase family protein [Desulfobacterales bacterium]